MCRNTRQRRFLTGAEPVIPPDLAHKAAQAGEFRCQEPIVRALPVALYGDNTLDMATDLIDGEVRFFGLASPGLNLDGCDLHQRLLAEYEKTRPVAVDA